MFDLDDKLVEFVKSRGLGSASLESLRGILKEAVRRARDEKAPKQLPREVKTVTIPADVVISRCKRCDQRFPRLKTTKQEMCLPCMIIDVRIQERDRAEGAYK